MRYRERKQKDNIEYIVLHYTAFGNPTKERVKKFFETTNKCVSTHYVVDKTGYVELLNPNKCIAYHIGKGNGIVTNANSIGVDLCENKENTKSLHVNDTDWYFTDDTIEQAVTLVSQLLWMYDLPLHRVMRHYDVTGKLCPRPFVKESVNNWLKFIDKLKGKMK